MTIPQGCVRERAGVAGAQKIVFRLFPARLYAWALSCLLVMPGWLRSAELVEIEELGLRLAPGFKISLYADHDLAPDVYAMTLDNQGRVVITSAGYIKTLHDTDGDGYADKAVTFATPSSGGMGLCFEGNDLLFYGGGALVRYRDQDGDGVADGPPERIASLKAGEHGAHAIRKGPDGWWYLIGGNNTGFGPPHITLPNSPVRQPEAGALMRFSPDFKQSEIIAHGFRNPYDFDFNSAGELFTYDSDVEREYFLPWYTPTRLYQIAYGIHHGWRLPGHLRSWDRPGYYLDTVDYLSAIGRGSPTGVAVYRHHQFPSRFRDGLFFLDWTFGKVFFSPLERNGASYQTIPEIFLEPIGTHGFAPTDIEVAPDGALFISIGGRKTRGAVYRVEYTGSDRRAVPTAATEMEAVLRAPQPLEAWSRARWEPLARKLGAEAFLAAAANETSPPADRVRAIEIATELFDGLNLAVARTATDAASPMVRARAAWSLGRKPAPGAGLALLSLLQDRDALVRRCALETLAEQMESVKIDMLGAFLPSNFAHTEKRVRHAAARLLIHLPEREWNGFWNEQDLYGPAGRLTLGLARLWKNPDRRIDLEVVRTALLALQKTGDEALQLDALRLIMLALGDWNLHQPSLELYTAYEWPEPLAEPAALLDQIRQLVRPIFPAEGRLLNVESARLLAMLQDDNAALLARVAEQLTSESSPVEDFHYLTVISRLRAPLEAETRTKVAEAILNLDRKLEGQQQRSKQTWGERLAELTGELIRRDPPLAQTLFEHSLFASDQNVGLALLLPPEFQQKAAWLFSVLARKDKEFTWSPELIRLLAPLPAKEVRPLFRAQWSNRGLRDELLPHLVTPPEPADRDKFLESLSSSQPEIVNLSLKALLLLPPDRATKNLVPPLRLLQRLFSEPKQGALRQAVVTLISRQIGQPLPVRETATDAAALRLAYQSVFDRVLQKNPALIKILAAENEQEDPAYWTALLKNVPWDQGDVVRGENIFRERACQTCHASASSLGPDLAGATSRLSLEDLFLAIVYPNRDVAPPFRTTKFGLRNGETFTGQVVFTSADGVIVQTAATTTVRLDDKDIVSSEPSNISLMPGGLLEGLPAQGLADLYAYMKSLEPKR